MRFSPFIYHTYDNKWEAGSKTPPLYKVMLFTRRNGVSKEYMPLKIGFGKTELIDGRIMRLGKELKPEKAGYNAAADRKTALAELKALKAKGKEYDLPGLSAAGVVLRLCDERGSTSSTGPTSTPRSGAATAPSEARRRTTLGLSATTSNA